MLVHEQGHFDIAEIHTRHAREEVLNAVGGKLFPIPPTENQNLAIMNIAREIIGPIVDNRRKEMKIDQEQYEKYTLHGNDDEHQKEYIPTFAPLRN